MRTTVLGLLSILVVSSALGAVSTPVDLHGYLVRPTTQEGWDAFATDLCLYSSYSCGAIKGGGGGHRTDQWGFSRPLPAISEVLRFLRPELAEIGAKYGVDPRAIAGAILAENSLNNTMEDRFQQFLVDAKLSPRGEFLGKSFSYGMGQFHCDVAQQIESYAAGIEGRAVRSDQAVCDALNNPIETFKYIAAVEKKAQDTYLAQGFDLRGHPEVLVSLYNLGEQGIPFADRAAKSKAEGRAPWPNYLGAFAWYNLDVLSDITGMLLKPGQSPAQAMRVMLGREPGGKDDPVEPIRLTGDLPLTSSPECAAGCAPSVTIRARTRILEPLAIQEIASGGTSVLLRFETGEVGWASATSLVGRVEPATAPLCALKPTTGPASCEAALKAMGVAKDAQGYSLRIEGAAGADYRYPRGSVELEAQAGWSAIDAEAAQSTLQAMAAFKTRVMKSLNLGAWDSPQNPYRTTLDSSQWICKISECLAKGCFVSPEFSSFAAALPGWSDPAHALPPVSDFQGKLTGARVALNAPGAAAGGGTGAGAGGSCRIPGTGVELTASQANDLLALSQLASAPKSGGFCTYDREATLAKIQKILQSECVERVRIGDPELVKLVGGRALGQVIPYGKAKSFDRVYVDAPPLKQDCTEMIPNALEQARALAKIADPQARDDAATTLAKSFRDEGIFKQPGFVDSLVVDPEVPGAVQPFLATEWMSELPPEARGAATGKLLERLAHNPTEDGVGLYALTTAYRQANGGQAHPGELDAWTALLSQTGGKPLNGDALQRGMMLVSDWKTRDPEAYGRFTDSLAASGRLAFSVRAMQASQSCTGLGPLVAAAKKPTLTADEISGLHEILLRCPSSPETAALPALLANHPSESESSRADLGLILKTLPLERLLAVGDAVYGNPGATDEQRYLVDSAVAEATGNPHRTADEIKAILAYQVRRASRILANPKIPLEQRVTVAMGSDICIAPEFAGLKPQALAVLNQALKANRLTDRQAEIFFEPVVAGERKVPHFQCFDPSLDYATLARSRDLSGTPLQARFLKFASGQMRNATPEDQGAVLKALQLEPILAEVETRGDFPDDREWSDLLTLERARYGDNAQAVLSLLTRITKSCKNVGCVFRVTTTAQSWMGGKDLAYVDPKDPSKLWPGEEDLWAALLAQANLPGRSLRVKESIWSSLLELAFNRDAGGTPKRLKSTLLAASPLAGLLDTSDAFLGTLLYYDLFTQDAAFAPAWQAMFKSRLGDPNRFDHKRNPIPSLLSLVGWNLASHPQWKTDPGVRAFLSSVDRAAEPGTWAYNDLFEQVANLDPGLAKTMMPRMSAAYPGILIRALAAAGPQGGASPRPVDLTDPLSLRRGIETRLLVSHDPRALGDLALHWDSVPDAAGLVRRYVLEDPTGKAVGYFLNTVLYIPPADAILQKAFPFDAKLALVSELQAKRPLLPSEQDDLREFAVQTSDEWTQNEAKTQALLKILTPLRASGGALEWYAHDGWSNVKSPDAAKFDRYYRVMGFDALESDSAARGRFLNSSAFFRLANPLAERALARSDQVWIDALQTRLLDGNFYGYGSCVLGAELSTSPLARILLSYLETHPAPQILVELLRDARCAEQGIPPEILEKIVSDPTVDLINQATNSLASLYIGQFDGPAPAAEAMELAILRGLSSRLKTQGRPEDYPYVVENLGLFIRNAYQLTRGSSGTLSPAPLHAYIELAIQARVWPDTIASALRDTYYPLGISPAERAAILDRLLKLHRQGHFKQSAGPRAWERRKIRRSLRELRNSK